MHKKVISLLFLFGALFTHQTKLYAKDGSFSKERKLLLFSTGLLPSAFMWQVFSHESTHAITTKQMGYDVEGFYPYPHKLKGKFFLGRVRREIGKSTPKQVYISMAPAIGNIGTVALTSILLETEAVKPKTYLGAALYTYGIVAPLVDFGFNFFVGTDWKKTRRKLSFKHEIPLNILGILTLAANSYLAYRYGKKIYW